MTNGERKELMFVMECPKTGVHSIRLVVDEGMKPEVLQIKGDFEKMKRRIIMLLEILEIKQKVA